MSTYQLTSLATGVEFAAELFDLCHEDLRKLYPSLIPHIHITIYDVAPKILPMFDKGPSSSATLSTSITTPSGQKWSLKRHPKTGGLMVDDRFRVKLIPREYAHSSSSTSFKENGSPTATMQDVFAVGDVAVLEDGMLPATAQVANQEAKWLGKRLNKHDFEKDGFNFKNMGVMTYLGNMKAIMQAEGGTEVKGRMAWLIWRGAYLTQTVSWRNKLLIPIYWSINWIFGRDISRF